MSHLVPFSHIVTVLAPTFAMSVVIPQAPHLPARALALVRESYRGSGPGNKGPLQKTSDLRCRHAAA